VSLKSVPIFIGKKGWYHGYFGLVPQGRDFLL
jgi:hypothetical protein